jgi:hypothetical protein
MFTVLRNNLKTVSSEAFIKRGRIHFLNLFLQYTLDDL